MNEVHAQFERVIAGCMPHVVAKLILLLITYIRKCSDRGDELVVSVGLETRDRLRGRAERKRKRKPQIRVSSLREVQAARAENNGSKP